MGDAVGNHHPCIRGAVCMVSSLSATDSLVFRTPVYFQLSLELLKVGRQMRSVSYLPLYAAC